MQRLPPETAVVVLVVVVAELESRMSLQELSAVLQQAALMRPAATEAMVVTDLELVQAVPVGLPAVVVSSSSFVSTRQPSRYKPVPVKLQVRVLQA